MMNLIRADFYRISKGWVVYMPFAGIVLLHAVMIVINTFGLSGTMYVESLLSQAQLLFTIFMIPFVFCVSVPIFSDGTMKNDISWGMSRTKLYVSKLLIMALLSTLLYAFYIGSGMALATAIGGIGDIGPEYWGNLLQAMGAQMVGVLALCSVMIFLSFLLKKPYVLTEALGAVLLLPIIIHIVSSWFSVDLLGTLL